jgi:hypothetical protein
LCNCERTPGSGFNTAFIGRNNWNHNAIGANDFGDLRAATEANFDNQDEDWFYGIQFLCNDFQGIKECIFCP